MLYGKRVIFPDARVGCAGAWFTLATIDVLLAYERLLEVLSDD